jgi:hypothetical protein
MSHDKMPKPIELEPPIPRYLKRKRTKDMRPIQMWSSKKVMQSAQSIPAHVGDKQIKKKITRLKTENLLGFYDYVCRQRSQEKDPVKYEHLQKLCNYVIEEAEKREIPTDVLNKINHKSQQTNEQQTEA